MDAELKALFDLHGKTGWKKCPAVLTGGKVWFYCRWVKRADKMPAIERIVWDRIDREWKHQARE